MAAKPQGDAEGACCADMQSPNVPPALAEKPAGLPPRKYKLVGWDMDLTGRRLMDEICHIAAYNSPEKKYAQYIMPYRDLNPGARRRHNVRVVTVGRYRLLKDTKTQKVIKTKSEISALSEFMNWLESIKSKDEMIILMYHEPRRLTPIALIQALMRYRLLDRFKTIVSGFTDSYALCAEKCKDTFKSLSLGMLARMLLDADSQSVETAMERASATYKIIEQLANQAIVDQDAAASGEGDLPRNEMVEIAREFARPISTELEALEALKDLLDRQNTFRSVFRPLLRCRRPNRRRFTHLRRILADAGLLYDQLKDAWHDGRRAGLLNLMCPLEQTVKAEDIQELVDIFDCHFDPDKKPHYPPTKDAVARTHVPVEEIDELYLSSDESDSSGMTSSICSSLASAFMMAEEDEYLDL